MCAASRFDREGVRNLLKVAGDYLDPIKVLSGPDGASNWSLVAGPPAAGGCKGKSDSFICLDARNPVQLSLTSYSWTIQFNATSLLPESEWQLGHATLRPTPEWLDPIGSIRTNSGAAFDGEVFVGRHRGRGRDSQAGADG